jgi:hypothetical protein
MVLIPLRFYFEVLQDKEQRIMHIFDSVLGTDVTHGWRISTIGQSCCTFGGSINRAPIGRSLHGLPM